ncbi:MAG TPA: alpha-amylase family glycosyl hydrolase [Rectinemataceae bacterium]|nr:alpha-amylase family glycosyl hydrolase [Rectinemataceae bacterium]
MTGSIPHKIEELASYLYGEDEARRFVERLANILEREAPRKEMLRGLEDAKLRSRLSERDCLLITYADSLGRRDLGKSNHPLPPLRVLREFLDERGRGLFSHVHVLPFFPSSSDDGFSVVDYRSVESGHGDWADMRELGRGFRLVFDLVMNHSSAHNAWFEGFLRGDVGFDHWYLTRPEDYDSSPVVRPRTSPLLTDFRKADGESLRVWTTFSADQVDLNFGNPEVLLEFLSIILFYISIGAGTLRLDAIAYLWKEDGTSCINHPKTHAVVKLLRGFLDYLDLGTMILTETNVPHDQNVAYFGSGDEAHLVYNFALPPLVLHAAVSGDAGPLGRWAEKLERPPAGCHFLNFLASHDGIGLTPASGLVDEAAFAETLARVVAKGGRIAYKSGPAGTTPYELNSSYLSAVAPEGSASVQSRARAFLTTQAVMLSFDGVPAIYIHSWLGSGNWIEGMERLGYNRAINREKLEAEVLEAELDEEGSLRNLVNTGIDRLLRYRKLRAAFAPGVPQEILPAEGPLFALLRGPDAAGRRVLCVSNFSDSQRLFAFDNPLARGELCVPAFGTVWREYERGSLISELAI